MPPDDLDLPDDPFYTSSTECGSEGAGEEKEFAAESKDQVQFKNDFPLSPQWLHKKPSEEMTASVPLSQRKPLNDAQKDRWCHDGLQEKDWRSTAPYPEYKHHWRNDNWETDPVGRKESRKDREIESKHRKSDSSGENMPLGNTTETMKFPSSQRRHDVSGHTSCAKSRHNKRWSSCWGPEDKENSQIDKNVLADKETFHSDKQSSVGLSDSNSCDKWRPHHKQEAKFVVPAVYCAAPGSGLEGRQEDAPKMGFALGRGKSKIVGITPVPRTSSGGPIGSVPGDQTAGKCSLLPNSFRYPRGKLLDLYRKQNRPQFHNEETDHLTSSSINKPLAFIITVAGEQSILDDISKGKIIGSTESENLEEEDPVTIENEEKCSGICDPKKNTILSVEDPASFNLTTAAPKPDEILVDTAPNKEHGKLECEVCEDTNIPRTNEYLKDNDSSKLLVEGIRPEELTLFYWDPHGDRQGPFLAADITSWFGQGFFGIDLPVCLSNSPIIAPIQQLGDIMPHLKLHARSTLVSTSGSPELPSVSTENMEATPSTFTSTTSKNKEWLMSKSFGSLDRTDDFWLSNAGDAVLYHENLPHLNPGNLTKNLFLKEQSSCEFRASDAEDERYQRSLPGQKVRVDNDTRHLCLLLEGTHLTHPLSLNTSSSADQGNLIQPAFEQGIASDGMHTLHDTNIESPTMHAMSNSHRSIPPLVDHSQQLSHLGQEPYQHNTEQTPVEQRKRQHPLKKSLQTQPQTQFDHKFSTVEAPFYEPQLKQLQQQKQLQLQRQHKQLQLQQHLQQQQLLQQHKQQQVLQQKLKLQQHPFIQHQMPLLEQQQSPTQKIPVEQLLQQQLVRSDYEPSLVNDLPDRHINNQLSLIEHFQHDLQQQSCLASQARHFAADMRFGGRFDHPVQDEQSSNLAETLSHVEHGQVQTLKQQNYVLDQEQLCAQRFPGWPRHFNLDVHVGSSSGNERGQFIRTPSRHVQSPFTGPSQSGFFQQHMRQSFEQNSHPNQDIAMHESEYGFCEPRSEYFGKTTHRSAGVPEIKHLNSFSRPQGLDLQDQHDPGQPAESYSSLPYGMPSNNHKFYGEFSISSLNAAEGCWSDSDSQLSIDFLKSEFKRLHLDVEGKKWDPQMNLALCSLNSWSAKVNPKQESMEVVRKDGVNSSWSKEVVNPAFRRSSGYPWHFSAPNSENPINLKRDQDGSFDTFHVSGMNHVRQTRSTSRGANLLGKNIKSGERLAFRSSPRALAGNEHFFFTQNNINSVTSDCGISADASAGRLCFLDDDKNSYIQRMTMESEIDQSRYSADNAEIMSIPSDRHPSFVSSRSSMDEHKFDKGTVSAYNNEIEKQRIFETIPQDSEYSLLTQGGLQFKSGQQATTVNLSSVPCHKGKNPIGTFSRGADVRPGGNIHETSNPSKGDMEFQGSSSATDTYGAEPSFIDILKSNTKPTTEADSSKTVGSSDQAQGSRSQKKKREKGKQIDPSLLGFKVDSNRILKGTICRPRH